MKLSDVFIYPLYFRLQVRWLSYSAHPCAPPLRGRSELRLNLLPADLSHIPVTYLCKPLDIHLVAALQGSK